MAQEDRQVLHDSLKQYPSVLAMVDTFIIKLKRRQIEGSFAAAKQTIELCRTLLGNTKWHTARHIIDTLRLLGRVLMAAQPLELVVGNVIRRVMYIVREEYTNAIKNMPEALELSDTKTAPSLSLQTILAPNKLTDYSVPIKELKQTIMEGLTELVDEIDTMYENIADQALEHIHADEVILTCGESKTVLEFFKAAGKKRQFKVIVLETGPTMDGQRMARSLSLAGISTTLITDSAIFAMMARVNKVVISTSKVVANGGLITKTGTHNVALAAKEMSVPLVCVAGLYKLSPMYPHDLDGLNDLLSPAQVLPEEDSSFVTALNPAFDYVPPELVDLFITNIGGHQPSYIYRLLVEYYCPEDYDFSI